MRTMWKCLTLATLAVIAQQAYAQLPARDPDIVGPARRAAGAAGEAVGAPGVENRIEARQQQRDLRRADDNPNAAQRAMDRQISPNDRWRYTYHNNQWWYSTPQNRWMIYSNNSWGDYDPATYVAPRYTTGYRGTVTLDTTPTPVPEVNINVAPAVPTGPTYMPNQGPVYDNRPYYNNYYRRGLFGRRVYRY